LQYNTGADARNYIRFLWAKLQLEQFCRIKEETDILTAINSLPKTLEGIYQNIFRQLLAGQATWELVRRTSLWLLYMREPMTAETFLAAVVYLDPANTSGKKPTIPKLLSSCFSLVIHDTKCNVFGFHTYQSRNSS
jgi:hypothetical protein